ncbi:MAG: hypothetical protein NTW21_04525 [Verrucomicrobia bacterium]|nr:hypothetical protein [Verrucomicrobiota bacterium]
MQRTSPGFDFPFIIAILAAAPLWAPLHLPAQAVIDEPFAQAVGPLNGQAAGTGLTGTWTGNDKVNVTSDSLHYGSLLTSGNRVQPTGVAPDWWNNGAGVSPGTTLSAAGLLAPSAELWFSCLVQSFSDGSSTYFCLGNGVADGWGRMGSGGVGFRLTGGKVYAYPGNGTGGWSGPGATVPNGVNLFVGKITWGPDSSTSGSISIYLPGTDLALPATAASTEATHVIFDQATFNTISFANGNGNTTTPVIDEIRFGASYADVTPAAAGDNTPPEPSPMTWASVPAGSDENQITMTATTATDVSGVEYYFQCTAGGGHDSDWQASPTYTDTGLTPATSYSYQVKARDLSVSANETLGSSVESTSTLPADITPPDPSPMTWATPPAAGSNTAIAMTATTASDPHGVEYFFTNTTVSGHDSGWQASPAYIDVGLSPGTAYTYQVTARDKSLARNETLYAEASATTDLLASTMIYEPFAGATGPLNGQTAGTGLSGNWWGNDKVNVTAGSLSYGSLATSGNHAVSSGVAPDWWNNGAGTSPGTTLRNAGLLAPGAELWFSALVVSYPDQTTYFGLGKGAADGWGRLSSNDNSPGIGFVLSNGKLDAYYWDGGGGHVGTPTAITIPDGVHLVVGKIVWGATPAASATLSIYLPGTDLAMPVTAATAITSGIVVDQSILATISFANGNGQTVPPEIDEIRFGGSYETVVVAGAVSDPDYIAWTALYPGANLSDPAADLDQDGLTNDQERIWGLDPTSASSVNPYAVALKPAAGATTGTFSYTRRKREFSGLTYTIWTSTTLEPGSWTEDTAASASQAPGTPDANHVETVAVTLTASPENGKLFVRVQTVK